MIPIYEMSLINYNANKDGRDTSDCTIRSLSLAYDLPYEEVSKELRGTSKGKTFSYNATTNINGFIVKHGWTPIAVRNGVDVIWNKSDVVTTEQFADEHPVGTYLCLTGKKPKGSPTEYSRDEYENYNHLLCIIDGNVYDSWNSMKQYVRQYCVVDDKPNTTVNVRTNETNEVDLLSLTNEALAKCVDQYLLNADDFKIINWNADIPMGKSEVVVEEETPYSVRVFYQFYTQAQIDMPKEFNNIDSKKHSSSFIVKITPKTPIDDIPQLVDEQVETAIKKLASYYKKEQKYCNETTGMDLTQLYPSLDANLRGVDQGALYKLLKSADPYIQKNIVDVSDWGKEWSFYVKPDPSDDTDEEYVQFVFKNASQLKTLFGYYEDDLKNNSTQYQYHYYNYF